MSNKLFNQSDIKKLMANPYVKNVSEKSITYTDEFKRLFIVESEKGRLPGEIFEAYGFSIEMIGASRPNKAANRWRKGFKERGIDGLKDTRKGNSGRPSHRELTLDEKYERLMAQNKLLQAENELLKKLEMVERRRKNKKIN
jgi:transposase